MSKYHCFHTLILFLLLWGCNSKSALPPLQQVADLPGTEMVSSMDQPVDWSKNQLYCVSLDYAWEAVRKALEGDAVVDERDEALWRLHHSPNPEGVLAPDEIDVSARVQFKAVSAVARFEKQLPFSRPFEANTSNLNFAGTPVQHFGTWGNAQGFDERVSIAYYGSEHQFAVRLLPAEENHEIWLLAMEQPLGNSLQTCWEKSMIHMLINYSPDEQPAEELWRYEFLENDRLQIPMIAFQLMHDYPEMIGKNINVLPQSYQVLAVSQRVGLVLNESGATVRSESEVAVASEAVEAAPPPKAMIFDRPFLLALKRKDVARPYLLAWVANSEWMVAMD